MRLEVVLLIALPILVLLSIVLLSGNGPSPLPGEGYENDRSAKALRLLRRLFINLCAAVLVVGASFAFATGLTMVILRAIFSDSAHPLVLDLVKDMTVIQLHSTIYLLVVILIFTANLLYNVVRSWLWHRRYKRSKKAVEGDL